MWYRRHHPTALPVITHCVLRTCHVWLSGRLEVWSRLPRSRANALCRSPFTEAVGTLTSRPLAGGSSIHGSICLSTPSQVRACVVVKICSTESQSLHQWTWRGSSFRMDSMSLRAKMLLLGLPWHDVLQIVSLSLRLPCGGPRLEGILHPLSASLLAKTPAVLHRLPSPGSPPDSLLLD